MDTYWKYFNSVGNNIRCMNKIPLQIRRETSDSSRGYILCGKSSKGCMMKQRALLSLGYLRLTLTYEYQMLV